MHNMMEKTINLDRNGPVASLDLNMPPINAFDETALEDLSRCLDRIESDKAIRVVYVVSKIENIFCAGGDLKFWPMKYPDRPELIHQKGNRVFKKTVLLQISCS